MKIAQYGNETLVRHWGKWYLMISIKEYAPITINKNTIRKARTA